MLDRVDRKLVTVSGARSRRLAGGVASVAIVIAGLLAGGCGSSSSTSSTSSTATTAALTKTQFLAQGNAICTQGNKKLEGSEKSLGGKPSEAQITTFVRGPFKSEVQRQIDAIRALGAPTGEAATVTHMLDLAQADLDRVTADPKVLATAKVSPFKDFSTVAHAYGLTVCAEEN
jgi:hypothetical protein